MIWEVSMSDKKGGLEPPTKKLIQETIEEPMASVSTSFDKDTTVEIPTYDVENRYRVSDNGPFYVYVEHINKNLGRLFPVRVGHYLFNNNEFKHNIVDIKSVGINRVKVIFKSYEIANKLINHDLLAAYGLIAYIPKFYTHKKGIIKMVDTYFDESYLMNAIQSKVKVVEVKRMMRRITDSDNTSKLVPRQIIIVTFLGNNLPANIQINLVNFIVEPYIYPVVQCHKCLRYGHTAKLCKGNQKCKKCTKTYDENHICESDSPYCIHCKSEDHSSISKMCPIYKKQNNIKRIMAVENLSFKEAEKIENNPSYAKIATNNSFSLLSNLENFPDLPINKSNMYNETQHILKRPAAQPSPKKTVTKKTQPIIPNPYRDEFIEYKEKLISEISLLVRDVLKNPSYYKQNFANPDTAQSNIRSYVANILGDNTDTHSQSDNDSTY